MFPPCWPVERISWVVAGLRNEDRFAVLCGLEFGIGAEAELPPEGGFIEDVALDLTNMVEVEVEVFGVGLLPEPVGSSLERAVVGGDVGFCNLGFRHVEFG